MEPETGTGPAPAGAPGTPVALAGAAGATYAHLVSLVGAFAFWAWLDRGLWFFGDEWDFLVQRGLWHWPTNPGSIWFPHNEHWSTLPILLWRALFNVFHLSTYWPYLVPVLLLQVGIMHLSWRLSRRAGVPPWTAAAAVALLGFLGAGAENLTWAFQVGFMGSVFFGLLALELLDSGGPAAGRGRATAAALALVASLMCSTVGDAMVVAAGVLVAARLPRRRALGIVGPPVGIYILWFLVVGRLGLSAHSDRIGWDDVTGLPNYLWTGLSSALGQTFNLAGAGGAILVGLSIWVAVHARALWARHPALLGLCAAVVSFYVLVGLGRDTTTVDPAMSRYVYVALALLVPVMAKLLSPARAGIGARAAAAGLLLFSTLGDLGQGQTWAAARQALTTAGKTDVLAAAALVASGVHDVSGPGAPPIGIFPNLSEASLRNLARSHFLPHVHLSALELVNARTLLALGTWNGSATALTRAPLFGGRFSYEKSTYAQASAQPGDCLTFAPDSLGPVQVWLRVAGGKAAASLGVDVAPAVPGATDYLAGVLVPPAGPTTSEPVELVVPARGHGYLSDNDPRALLVITWNVGTPLTICGLASTGV